MGIKEQLIFPEIEYDKVEKVRGMDITFVTTAKTDERQKNCCRFSECHLPGAKGGICSGKEIHDIKAAKKTQILDTILQSLQALWQTTCVSKKIWHLPYLLQGTGIQGSDSWCKEGKLVTVAKGGL